MPPLNQPMYYVRDVPAQYLNLSRTLRILCLFPSIWGIYTHLTQARRVSRDALIHNIDPMRSTALDNYVGVLWCLLGGIWSLWLTNNLIRRWFLHYEPRPAMIRLFTLGTIFWFSVFTFVSYFGPDEPIWPWMVICAILAVAQVIQTIHFRAKGHYKLEAKIKPFRDAKSVIYRTVLIPGGIVSFLTMVMLLHQNNMRPSTAEVIANGGTSSISATSNAKISIGVAEIQVLIIIFSTWTPRALQRRQEIRETSLKLIPPTSATFAYSYKFVLGEPPSNHARNSMSGKISDEMKRYDDIVLLPVPDVEGDRSFKTFKALEWSNNFKFDFLCKTSDDMFVRWDTIIQELSAHGPSQYYWQGLAFWAMSPIVDPKDKKSYQQDSRHEILPPFVSGSYFTVSRDVVSLLTFPGPRLFTKHEDQDIGVWLYSYGIKPIHDRRIQEWDVCENDLIAKRFGDGFKPRESMRPMYHNVIERKPLCTGYRQEMCAPCYPCTGRTGHWKENGLYCDSVRGITLRKDNTDLETSLSFDIKDKLPSITSSQEWIIPGLLSETSSIFSDSEDWVRLHWTHWDKDQSAWQQRNTHALESLFIHSPDAVVVFISNTLSPSFFSHFTQQGYQIHIISYSKDSLLRHHWFVDSGTEEWLRRWDEWSQKGKYFSNHLKDYIRMIVMYKYGGLYMDLNAFWLRAPGDRIAEFIGSDISDNDDDLAWSLDEKNTFLTTHVMRFQRGRSMFKSIAVSAFTPSTYDPDCHSCGSTKGFTSYAKPRRISLEKNGVRILPREALYPYTEKEGAAILEMTGKAIEDVLRLEEKSLCLYLHDGASSHKPAAAGSILSEASRIWSLDLLSRTHPQGSWIQGPKTFYIRVPAAQSQPRSQDTLLGKEPGLFRGVDSIFVRGDGELVGQPVFKQANILLSVEEGLISMDSTAAGSKKIEMDLGSSVNLAQINLALSKMKYIPPTSRTWTGADRAHVRVEFGSMRQELDIPILRRTI